MFSSLDYMASLREAGFTQVQAEIIARGTEGVMNYIGEVKKELHNDMSGLKTDMNNLKNDVNNLKVDVNNLKTDVALIANRLGTLIKILTWGLGVITALAIPNLIHKLF